MKRVRNRSLMILLMTVLLLIGMMVFLFRWANQGRDWVGYFSNTTYYTNGSIYDRNGITLYDGGSRSYNESGSIRRAVMHLVGDQNIATSMRNVQAGRLSGFHPVTGTASGGHDLYLTVDAKLNEIAYNALNGRKGVVAVYNYITGEVICQVSAPAFDPLNPPSNLDDPRYEGAYLNRFFSSVFTPGSIFKIVTTAVALEELNDLETWRYTCTGEMEFGAQSVTCPSVHGAELTLAQAFAHSCNCAYAQLALDLGGSALQKMAKKGGLLSSVEISGVTTGTGVFEIGGAGSIELAWSGSGQYHNMVSPATFLTLMGSIANGGTAVLPTFLMKETFSGTSVPSALRLGSGSEKLWKSATCNQLKEMMRNNVVEIYGQARFGDLAVCAKSGTAEVGGGNAPHAWFAGFIDDAQHPLAFVVLVENGGSGSSVAGEVAAKVLLAATE